MKKMFVLFVLVVCAGCAIIGTNNQEEQNLANELEVTNDPVKVVKAYIYDYKCDVERTGCIKTNKLMEPNINFKCTTYTKDYNNNRVYTDSSDECILFRRSKYFHESSVDYFDYKRFLGVNSVIKTDEDFLQLVKYYDKISECYTPTEITSAEKKACVEQKEKNMRKIAFKRVPCSELAANEYNEAIKEYADWFNWAIDHDPNEKVNELVSLGVARNFAAQYYYLPVLSKSEASQQVREKISTFSYEQFCTPDNWVEKLRQMGCGI